MHETTTHHHPMSTATTEKPSNGKEKQAISVRVNLSKILTEQELDSFREQAEAHGRTIREHFLAITIGSKESAA
jgi:hypothetical protein